MTREESIIIQRAIKENLHETGKDFPYRDEMIPVMKESCDMAIKALEQEPCDDAISRQAVEEIIWEEPSYADALNVLAEVRDKVRTLPSVTPQQKTGQWIQVENDKCKCDQCEVIQFIAIYPYGHKNYCPNCGAKMGVSENE